MKRFEKLKALVLKSIRQLNKYVHLKILKKERRQNLRFSFLNTQALSFSVSARGLAPQKINDISHDGLSISICANANEPFYLPNSEIEGLLITPFFSRSLKVALADCNENVISFRFLSKYSDYLPLIHDLLSSSFLAQKYTRLELNARDNRMLCFQKSDSLIKFHKNQNAQVDGFELYHYFGEQKIELIYSKGKTVLLDNNGVKLSSSQMEQVFYLLAGVVEYYQIENTSDLFMDLTADIRTNLLSQQIAS